MKKERRDREFILDIYSAVEKILRFTEDMSFNSFVRDERTIDAVLRNIEVMGESAKHISDNLQSKYPSVEWKNLAKTRDKLIHGYFEVDVETVWNIVIHDLPKLIKELNVIIQKENFKKD
jgi:uncharacterized protein with HEPN domain